MALHSKWSSGDLIFYDGTQNILTIKNKSQGLEVGEDSSGIPFKFFGNTASAFMNWNSASDKLEFDLADIAIGETDNIYFGDANELGMAYDGTQFVLTPDSCGEDMHFGSANKPLDVVNYGNITYRDPDTPAASSTALTLTADSNRIQFIDPNTTHSALYLDVNLPPATGAAGIEFKVFNVATGTTGGGLQVNSSVGGEVVLIIEQGCGGVAVCDGATWLGFQGMSS